MKKTLLLSLVLVSSIYAEVEVVESIPLTEHDLKVLSQGHRSGVRQEMEVRSSQEQVPSQEAVVLPSQVVTQEEAITKDIDSFKDDNIPQVVKEPKKSLDWVNDMGSSANIVNTKSYLKGMLNGLAYNGESVSSLKSKSTLRSFYANRDYATFWISQDYAINPNIFEMMSAIRDAANHGLDSQKYHIDELTTIIDIIKDSTSLDANSRNINIAKLDIYLSDAFLTMAKDLYEGEIDMDRFKEELRQKANESDIHYSWDLPSKHKNYKSLLNSMQNSSDLQNRLFLLSNSNNMLDSLVRAYARYKDIELQGGWPTIPRGNSIRVGTIDKKRVPLLAKRLYMSGDFDDPNYTSGMMSKELSNALKHFQDRMGIWDSGKLNSRTRRLLNIPVEERLKTIALNISRLRNEVKDFGNEYIIINIPSFRMNFVRDNQNIMGMRVVVGKKRNPTPIFSAKMSYFEINPYWTVPKSIVKKEMLHRIQEDPDYLTSRRFKMYRSWKKDRKPVDAFDVDWWKYDDESELPFNFVKEPGAGNPLGFVKFMFPNNHSVYMHDTDEKRFFKSSIRAYSHGCIRLQKPQELLEYITQNYTNESLDQIEDMKRSKKNHSVKLNSYIPVHIRYFTAWANEDGGVSFRDDIYGYDKMQKRLMNR